MRCIKCGFENVDGAGFCGNCGNTINSTQAQPQQSVPNSSLNTINSVPTATTSSVVGSTAVATASGVGITKIIIAIVVALVVIVGGIIGASYLFGDKDDKTDTNSSENSSTNSNGSSSSNTNVDYSKYTASVPRSDRDLDYYWNINTATFDKSKFDGRISVFGTIMNTKLTGKTIKDAGFTFVTWSSDDGDAKEQTELNYDLEDEYHSNYGLLYINDKVYPTYNYNVTVNFVNYKGINAVYDDSTELYFSQTTIYQDSGNLVVPYMENVDYSDMTIDDIIDTLGVPTYVEGRASKLEDAGKSFGSTTFNYIYVYDDYTFKFNFMHYDNTGFSITGITYMGSQEFGRPVEVFNWDTMANDVYDTYSKFLDKQQDEYLKAIGKK